jgi:hypothetical protein
MDSTPSTSPSIHGKSSGKENRAAGARLDLMSLAPEQKQEVSTVKRGWSEGGVVTTKEGGVKAEKAAETLSVKEIARKMHGECVVFSAGSIVTAVIVYAEMKNSVRDFEAKFIGEHKRKVSIFIWGSVLLNLCFPYAFLTQPSNHEKSPIRNKLIELAKLKKLFKGKVVYDTG